MFFHPDCWIPNVDKRKLVCCRVLTWSPHSVNLSKPTTEDPRNEVMLNSQLTELTCAGRGYSLCTAKTNAAVTVEMEVTSRSSYANYPFWSGRPRRIRSTPHVSVCAHAMCIILLHGHSTRPLCCERNAAPGLDMSMQCMQHFPMMPSPLGKGCPQDMEKVRPSVRDVCWTYLAHPWDTNVLAVCVYRMPLGQPQ